MGKVLVHFNIPEMTSKQFDAAWEDLRAAGITSPAGLIHHTGAADGNNWLVVDVWESAQAFAKFGEILGPILHKHGVDKVVPKVLPVHYDLVAEQKAGAR
jgi:hypothetical protein